MSVVDHNRRCQQQIKIGWKVEGACYVGGKVKGEDDMVMSCKGEGVQRGMQLCRNTHYLCMCYASSGRLTSDEDDLDPSCIVLSRAATADA